MGRPIFPHGSSPRTGAWSQQHPSSPERKEKSESGVRKRVQVSTPTSPTSIDRDSGSAELEVHEGDQVSKPPLPTRRDRYSGAAVRGVGGARGAPGNNTTPPPNKRTYRYSGVEVRGFRGEQGRSGRQTVPQEIDGTRWGDGAD